jgi:hypothetical protein
MEQEQHGHGTNPDGGPQALEHGFFSADSPEIINFFLLLYDKK